MYYGTGSTATAVNLTEVTNFTNGRILWNLYNCTANVTTRLLYASLLAPDASVTLGQNMNGTVIANNVTVSAESHRDDFLGGLSNGVTVTGTKVWSDYATGAPANTSVTFQLYRSTDGGTTRTAYGTPVTRNATTGWSYSWTELPTGSLYTIVETTVLKGSTDVTANYAATYSTQTGVASGTITVSNQYLYNLPETGGAGVLVFYVSGGGLLLLATLLVLRKRRSAR
jgi:LPXTG-motif cell wall-anchored protein